MIASYACLLSLLSRPLPRGLKKTNKKTAIPAKGMTVFKFRLLIIQLPTQIRDQRTGKTIVAISSKRENNILKIN